MADAEVSAKGNSNAITTPASPIEQNTQVLLQCSYAPMVDQDEGADLQFMPSSLINGVSCGKVELDVVKQEIDYWQHVVFCSVLPANQPFPVMQGFIRRIWSAYELNTIIQVRNGVFLVRFVHLQDKMTVETRGLYYFDSKPFLVKGWNLKMELHTESIKSLPLWVQLPDFDIKYWGQRSLSKIGSIIEYQILKLMGEQSATR